MITTKTIKPDKKELFKIILITRLKPLLWLCGLLFLYLLLDFIFKLNNGGIFPYLFTVFLISVIIIIGLWRSLNSEKNKMHFIERYFEIDNEKIFSKHIDGSSSTTMIHNYKEVKRIKKGYIFTFIDSRIWFLPFYAFNNYDELTYFETEVADKINKNTYLKNNPIRNININFNIPDPPVKYSKKKRRFIKLGIIVLVLALLSPLIHTCVKYFPHIEYGETKYFSLLKDSVTKDIDTRFAQEIKSNGNLFDHYNYSTSHKLGFTDVDTVYYIDIWEFKDLNKADFNATYVKKDKMPIEIKVKTLFKVIYKDSLPLIKERFGYEFINSKLNINIDSQTEIVKTFDTPNYKGFFGKVNSIRLTDEKGEPQMLLKYKYPKKTLFLLYKTKQSFIIIRVNCNHDEAINENVLNFFNLK